MIKSRFKVNFIENDERNTYRINLRLKKGRITPKVAIKKIMQNLGGVDYE